MGEPSQPCHRQLTGCGSAVTTGVCGKLTQVMEVILGRSGTYAVVPLVREDALIQSCGSGPESETPAARTHWKPIGCFPCCHLLPFLRFYFSLFVLLTILMFPSLAQGD